MGGGPDCHETGGKRQRNIKYIVIEESKPSEGNGGGGWW